MPDRHTIGYDVIGDVHGHAESLEALLETLGYEEIAGAYRHRTRTAVFVGDLVDRHPTGQRRTVGIVRAMCDVGAARIVLGNHEFNAVAYATEWPDGNGFCRSHDDRHTEQHRAFLDQFVFGSPDHRDVLDWFRTIPLWLDLGGLRVVHACWSRDDIDHLAQHLTDEHTLTDRVVVEGCTKGTATHRAIEHVLKGPEVHMGGISYLDKGGHRRHAARVRWWDPTAVTLDEAAHLPSDCELTHDGVSLDRLPDTPLVVGSVPRYDDTVPVIFGHYWWSGDLEVQTPLVTCVDYSAGLGGPLVAYRWDEGDTELHPSRMVTA